MSTDEELDGQVVVGYCCGAVAGPRLPGPSGAQRARAGDHRRRWRSPACWIRHARARARPRAPIEQVLTCHQGVPRRARAGHDARCRLHRLRAHLRHDGVVRLRAGVGWRGDSRRGRSHRRARRRGAVAVAAAGAPRDSAWAPWASACSTTPPSPRVTRRRAAWQRVLIVDFDVHHGNGTQDIFYEDPTVFYVSTHQTGIYPGTGDESEIGVGRRRGLQPQRAPAGGRGRRRAGAECLRDAWSARPRSGSARAGAGVGRLRRPLPRPAVAACSARGPDTIGCDARADGDRRPATCAMAESPSCLEGGYDLPALGNGVVNMVQALTGGPSRTARWAWRTTTRAGRGDASRPSRAARPATCLGSTLWSRVRALGRRAGVRLGASRSDAARDTESSGAPVRGPWSLRDATSADTGRG